MPDHCVDGSLNGLPWFIKHAENRWEVHSLGADSSDVEARAEIEVSLFLGVFLAPLLKRQLGRIGVQTLEELKHYVERDQVHPRKLEAMSRYVTKTTDEAKIRMVR